MRHFEIEGGKPLVGRVAVGGAKNAATKQIVASLLTDEPVTLHNVPHIGDTAATIEMCASIGLRANWENDGGTLRLHTPSVRDPEVPLAFNGVNRIPILLLGPLLHRCGEAIVPTSAATTSASGRSTSTSRRCAQFGARQSLCRAGPLPRRRRAACSGASDRPALPQRRRHRELLLTAVPRRGRHRAPQRRHRAGDHRPDLRAAEDGRASSASTPTASIEIEGVERLRGSEHRPMSDRIEAASLGHRAALATGGDVWSRGAEQADMLTFLNMFRQVGGRLRGRRHEGIRFFHPGGAAAADRAGDGRPPRLHDRLAAAARVAADPGRRACRSSTRRSTRTASASPRRWSRWAPRSSWCASASARSPAASRAATSRTAPSSTARRRCAPPT